MKQKIEELKAKMKSKVEKVRHQVALISRAIKEVVKDDSNKGFFIKLGVIALIIGRIRYKRDSKWMKKFLNRNHYFAVLDGYEVENKRLTMKNCKKYQKLIDAGYRRCEALVKSGIRKNN